MNRHLVFVLFLAVVFVLSAGLVAADTSKVMSGTGKVTAVDTEGKGIVIDVGSGKQAMTVGTVVGPDTKLMVKGKDVPLSDLQKDVKVGDTVTPKYEKSNDLYAKEIIKK